MEEFNFKQSDGITALSAKFTDFEYKTHSHEEYAIGVTLKGIQSYQSMGCRYRSYPGGVMLFNPEQPHDGMEENNSFLDYVMLYIKPKLFRQILDIKDTATFSDPVIYNENIRNKVINISYSLLHDGDNIPIEEQLISLSESLFPYYFDKDIKRDNSRIVKAKEMINDNLNSLINIDQLSSELGVSKYKLIRMFKKETGISPYQYYLSCKISYAKEIIDNTKDVYTAVTECDFTDLSHLNKQFKSIYGVTAFKYATELNKQ